MRILRRRRDRNAQQRVRRRVRMGVRHTLRTQNLTAQDRDNLSELLVDDDALDEVIDRLDQENPRLAVEAEEDDRPGRDWSGFFSALAEFLLAILPMLTQLFGGFSIPVGHTAQAIVASNDTEGIASLCVSLVERIENIEKVLVAANNKPQAQRKKPRR